MIAWMTRLLLILQLGIAGAFYYCGMLIWPDANRLGIAIACLAGVVLFRATITANNFMLASRFQSETPLERQLTRRQAWRLFKEEFAATMISSSWTMPFHYFNKRPADQPTGLPVLLIHGYGCNSGYWHAMSAALTRAHITHHAVSLEPIFADIKDYVPLLHRAIDQLCADSGHPHVIVVAHSMGGLAARAYLREHGAVRIARVITLGTPHNGTGLANFGVGHNSRQMRWHGSATNGMPSEWLRDMQQAEGEEFYRLFVSIYSHHDNIVSPQTSSYLPGAVNIEFHGIGHVALGVNPAIQQRVVKEIQEVSASSEATTDILPRPDADR